MRMRIGLAAAVLAMAVGGSLGACGGKGGDAPAKPAFKMTSEAQSKWDNLCVTCHGKSGHGDGPGAAGIKPKPRSFDEAEWQKSVTDEHLAKVIVEGGKAVGKSELMPASPDLASRKDLVDQLVKKVRSLGP